MQERLPAIPSLVYRHALRHGYHVLLLDTWIARRQRVHMAYDPSTGDWYAERELCDVLDWLIDRGVYAVIWISGTRRRECRHYIARIDPLNVYGKRGKRKSPKPASGPASQVYASGSLSGSS